MAFANEKLYLERLQAIMEEVSIAWDRTRFEVEQHVQSPIERAFAEALVSSIEVNSIWPPVCISPGQAFFPHQGLQIAPQYPIDRFRADFALVYSPGGARYRWLVVECDGHDFHEKTKEQARRDKARDRLFVSRGWTPMRFTGSEIHADPGECADQVGRYLDDFSNQVTPWRGDLPA